jgi:hypothetical protein
MDKAQEDVKQGPQYPANDQDVAAAHELRERVEEVERPQVLTPTNEPPLMVTDEDRAEAYAIGHLGPQATLLEWLAAHRRMKREAYALLAQKDAQLAEDEIRFKRADGLYQKLLEEHAKTLEDFGKDATKALVALSGAGICTPEETYGVNSSWTVSDLCRAVTSLSSSLAALKAAMDMIDGTDEFGQEECPRWRVTRQERIGRWCAEAFGVEHAMSLPQRGIRHLEEAAEAAQATGVDLAMAHKLLDHVWSRPVGNLGQELGGVAVTLLALAHAAGLNAEECEAREIRRVLNKPLKHFAERNAAKNAAGFNVAPPSPPTTEAATDLPG